MHIQMLERGAVATIKGTGNMMQQYRLPHPRFADIYVIEAGHQDLTSSVRYRTVGTNGRRKVVRYLMGKSRQRLR